MKSEQPSGLLTQEIEKDVLFGCESTNVSTGRLVNSCVPASVERLEKDKDADESVDAHQMRTRRLVKSGQSIGLFTQREEIDIDFRVSGLPHAVVKQAENFRVRELVKKIVSHPLREAFQAHLQQNNVYNPFSDDSKAMIRETGDVELFELCETTPKVQCSEGLLWLESRNDIIALVDISWLKANPAKIFTNGDWMLSQSRTSSSRRDDLVVLGTAKLLVECVCEERPHDMSTTTNTTQPQGLALCSRCHPAWASVAPQWVPARTPTVHWGCYNGRPWVARHQRHKCEVKMQ